MHSHKTAMVPLGGGASDDAVGKTDHATSAKEIAIVTVNVLMDYNVETIIVGGTFQHQKLGGAEDMTVVFVSNILSPNTEFFMKANF